MLNYYKKVSINNRIIHVDRRMKITIFMLKKEMHIYNGKRFSKFKTSIFSIPNLVGQFSLNRKIYAKPLKYFKFIF